MTRYKKYVREKGYKLENDYEYLPYHSKHTPTLEGVRTKIENDKIVVLQFYVVGTSIITIDRFGNVEFDFE